MRKVQLMPLAIMVQPGVPSILLPEGPRQQQGPVMVAGMVRWTVEEWDKQEYERIRRKVDGILSSNRGADIEEVVVKLAEELADIIGERNFSVTLGGFGVEYKADEKEEKR